MHDSSGLSVSPVLQIRKFHVAVYFGMVNLKYQKWDLAFFADNSV